MHPCLSACTGPVKWKMYSLYLSLVLCMTWWLAPASASPRLTLVPVFQHACMLRMLGAGTAASYTADLEVTEVLPWYLAE